MYDDLLAARQINGGSEAEDIDSVFDAAVAGDDDDDDASVDGGGGDDDDDDAFAAADADARPAVRRSEREGRHEGPIAEPGCTAFAPRPTSRQNKRGPW